MDFERGRAEAFEHRNALAKRAEAERASASAQRDRLERGSPSSGRRNFAGILNALVADAASREMPGLSALEGIRKARLYSDRTAAQHNAAHEKFEKSGGVGEAFNRLRKDDIATGDASTRARYDPSGSIEPISPEWLLAAAKLLIAEARRRAADAPKGRRD